MNLIVIKNQFKNNLNYLNLKNQILMNKMFKFKLKKQYKN
jgi:hypothetical protein